MGFSIHTSKSVLIPTQKIEFLGFLVHSKNMKISLTNKKAEHLTLKIKKFLVNKSPNIRQLAWIIGSVISIFHAVPLGKVYYRDLEREKVSFLKKESGNFEAKIALNQHMVTELQWWLDAIPKAVSDTHTPEVGFIINAGARESGWGATDGVNSTGGIWSEHYKACSINYLELKAIHLAIKAYSNLWKGCKHIRIRSDNTTAIAHVNNMGG